MPTASSRVDFTSGTLEQENRNSSADSFETELNTLMKSVLDLSNSAPLATASRKPVVPNTCAPPPRTAFISSDRRHLSPTPLDRIRSTFAQLEKEIQPFSSTYQQASEGGDGSRSHSQSQSHTDQFFLRPHSRRRFSISEGSPITQHHTHTTTTGMSESPLSCTVSSCPTTSCNTQTQTSPSHTAPSATTITSSGRSRSWGSRPRCNKKSQTKTVSGQQHSTSGSGAGRGRRHSAYPTFGGGSHQQQPDQAPTRSKKQKKRQHFEDHQTGPSPLLLCPSDQTTTTSASSTTDSPRNRNRKQQRCGSWREAALQLKLGAEMERSRMPPEVVTRVMQSPLSSPARDIPPLARPNVNRSFLTMLGSSSQSQQRATHTSDWNSADNSHVNTLHHNQNRSTNVGQSCQSARTPIFSATAHTSGQPMRAIYYHTTSPSRTVNGQNTQDPNPLGNSQLGDKLVEEFCTLRDELVRKHEHQAEREHQIRSLQTSVQQQWDTLEDERKRFLQHQDRHKQEFDGYHEIAEHELDGNNWDDPNLTRIQLQREREKLRREQLDFGRQKQSFFALSVAEVERSRNDFMKRERDEFEHMKSMLANMQHELLQQFKTKQESLDQYNTNTQKELEETRDELNSLRDNLNVQLSTERKKTEQVRQTLEEECRQLENLKLGLCEKMSKDHDTLAELRNDILELTMPPPKVNGNHSTQTSPNMVIEKQRVEVEQQLESLNIERERMQTWEREVEEERKQLDAFKATLLAREQEEQDKLQQMWKQIERDKQDVADHRDRLLQEQFEEASKVDNLKKCVEAQSHVLDVERKKIQQDFEDMQVQHNLEVAGQREHIEAELSSLDQQRNELERMMESLDQQRIALHAEQDQQEQHLLHARTHLQQKEKQLEDDVQKLNTLKMQFEKDRVQLNKDKDRFIQQQSDGQKDYSKLQAKLEQFTEEQLKVNDLKNSLITEREELNSQRGLLEEERKHLQSRQEEFEEEKEKSSRELTMLKSQIATQSSELQSLQESTQLQLKQTKEELDQERQKFSEEQSSFTEWKRSSEETLLTDKEEIQKHKQVVASLKEQLAQKYNNALMQVEEERTVVVVEKEKLRNTEIQLTEKEMELSRHMEARRAKEAQMMSTSTQTDDMYAATVSSHHSKTHNNTSGTVETLDCLDTINTSEIEMCTTNQTRQKPYLSFHGDLSDGDEVDGSPFLSPPGDTSQKTWRTRTTTQATYSSLICNHDQSTHSVEVQTGDDCTLNEMQESMLEQQRHTELEIEKLTKEKALLSKKLDAVNQFEEEMQQELRNISELKDTVVKDQRMLAEAQQQLQQEREELMAQTWKMALNTITDYFLNNPQIHHSKDKVQQYIEQLPMKGPIDAAATVVGNPLFDKDLNNAKQENITADSLVAANTDGEVSHIAPPSGSSCCDSTDGSELVNRLDTNTKPSTPKKDANENPDADDTPKRAHQPSPATDEESRVIDNNTPKKPKHKDCATSHSTCAYENEADKGQQQGQQQGQQRVQHNTHVHTTTTHIVMTKKEEDRFDIPILTQDPVLPSGGNAPRIGTVQTISERINSPNSKISMTTAAATHRKPQIPLMGLSTAVQPPVPPIIPPLLLQQGPPPPPPLPGRQSSSTTSSSSCGMILEPPPKCIGGNNSECLLQYMAALSTQTLQSIAKSNGINTISITDHSKKDRPSGGGEQGIGVYSPTGKTRKNISVTSQSENGSGSTPSTGGPSNIAAATAAYLSNMSVEQEDPNHTCVGIQSGIIRSPKRVVKEATTPTKQVTFSNDAIERHESGGKHKRNRKHQDEHRTPPRQRERHTNKHGHQYQQHGVHCIRRSSTSTRPASPPIDYSESLLKYKHSPSSPTCLSPRTGSSSSSSGGSSRDSGASATGISVGMMGNPTGSSSNSDSPHSSTLTQHSGSSTTGTSHSNHSESRDTSNNTSDNTSQSQQPSGSSNTLTSPPTSPEQAQPPRRGNAWEVPQQCVVENKQTTASRKVDYFKPLVDRTASPPPTGGPSGSASAAQQQQQHQQQQQQQQQQPPASTQNLGSPPKCFFTTETKTSTVVRRTPVDKLMQKHKQEQQSKQVPQPLETTQPNHLQTSHKGGSAPAPGGPSGSAQQQQQPHPQQHQQQQQPQSTGNGQQLQLQVPVKDGYVQDMPVVLSPPKSQKPPQKVPPHMSPTERQQQQQPPSHVQPQQLQPQPAQYVQKDQLPTRGEGTYEMSRSARESMYNSGNATTTPPANNRRRTPTPTTQAAEGTVQNTNHPVLQQHNHQLEQLQQQAQQLAFLNLMASPNNNGGRGGQYSNDIPVSPIAGRPELNSPPGLGPIGLQSPPNLSDYILLTTPPRKVQQQRRRSSEPPLISHSDLFVYTPPHAAMTPPPLPKTGGPYISSNLPNSPDMRGGMNWKATGHDEIGLSYSIMATGGPPQSPPAPSRFIGANTSFPPPLSPTGLPQLPTEDRFRSYDLPPMYPNFAVPPLPPPPPPPPPLFGAIRKPHHQTVPSANTSACDLATTPLRNLLDVDGLPPPGAHPPPRVGGHISSTTSTIPLSPNSKSIVFHSFNDSATRSGHGKENQHPNHMFPPPVFSPPARAFPPSVHASEFKALPPVGGCPTQAAFLRDMR